MTMTVLEKDEKSLYQSAFEKAVGGLPGSGAAWLRSVRQAAISRFAELGFPTDQDEAWRFTPVAPIARTPFLFADKTPDIHLDTLRGLALCPLGLARLVFVNGRYDKRLSYVPELPEGVRVESMAAALSADAARLEPHLARRAGAQGPAFPALNAAFFSDGAVVFVPKGRALEAPIHLIFVSSAPGAATMSHSRVLIVAEAGSTASVIEEYVGLERGVCFTNVVTEITLGEDASLEFHKIQRESDKTLHVSTTSVRQARDSRFTSHVVSLGGALTRNDAEVALEGEGADCELNGLYLVRGRQHVDNHTVIDHARPHGTSRELYKGVLDGQARAVFNGTIVVRPDAQKTDARLYNKNLLLSEDGMIDTKPEFKIDANDVQCRHGATIGQISADALFYLRSRGMGPEEARRLLVHAFASEMVERLKVETLREALSEALHERLPEEAQ